MTIRIPQGSGIFLILPVVGLLLLVGGRAPADLNPSANGSPVTQSGTWTIQPGNTPNTTPWLMQHPASTLAITALSTANTQVTATLPAVAGQFHYITAINVTRTCTAALTGTAALAITTTNLPGTLAYTAGNACAVGSTNNDLALYPNTPLKSSVVNTATTVVCPAAGAAVVCRISVLYFAAP